MAAPVRQQLQWGQKWRGEKRVAGQAWEPLMRGREVQGRAEQNPGGWSSVAGICFPLTHDGLHIFVMAPRLKLRRFLAMHGQRLSLWLLVGQTVSFSAPPLYPHLLVTVIVGDPYLSNLALSCHGLTRLLTSD